VGRNFKLNPFLMMILPKVLGAEDGVLVLKNFRPEIGVVVSPFVISDLVTSVLGDFCICPTEADFLWSREFFFVFTGDDFLLDLTDLFPPLSFGEIFKFPFLLLLFL
jgi:hypothetical protein